MISQKLNSILSVDIFDKGKDPEKFVGNLFYLDYEAANLLVSDAWKHKVKGVPQGAFLLAFYQGEPSVDEVLLLRVIGHTKLPSDNEVISSMVDYYKQGDDISGRAGAVSSSELDDFTRYEFSFSGLQCRVLGAFYKVLSGGEIREEFGADVENFYAANNYKVYKADGDVLKKIVNQRDLGLIPGNENESRIGLVRYSSTRRFQASIDDVEVFISPQDFVGKRTALFGMTRTGKSNTVKKIIESTEQISRRASQENLPDASDDSPPFNKQTGAPQYPVGQIIFDINGEYANPNLQDEGTAIYELFAEKVTRYSVLDKKDFKVLKVNFYNEIENGFELIKSYLDERGGGVDYVNNFLAVNLSPPEDYSVDRSASTRFDRLKAAYLCCLYRAGFSVPSNMKLIKFQGNSEINSAVCVPGIDPSRGISLEDACLWFEWVWENYDEDESVFDKYKKKNGREWASDDLKTLMVFLSTYKKPGKNNQVSGYKKIKTKDLLQLHTSKTDESFEKEIPSLLRRGKIVIVDLSQGSPIVQSLFSERICKAIFNNSMNRFVLNKPNNFIQFYFEEAHNLFPKKEDKDLSQIYNRLAKEGAKLHIGMGYATQEVSSISSNILKNTQNWFIAHLNNSDEIKELKKYYDFSDFMSSLIKFSSSNDKGFVRMKTYTNPFVVPIQVDKFLAGR
ncbi:hypothetical protein Y5S_00209 [Alcanivorax nanhaiticus]|uniref:Uncharacterized protein n=1 Tax=Alcanivorax nanhaiticus TaxID=1177154 RepID=A0A095SPN4_9GAMM|nr:DUF87 domain-containing protein [Alcanivorax nanhaiticus]KGD66542.1 hypothetical protein Y5S_00209 [Alcanivorax nanhaiticus]